MLMKLKLSTDFFFVVNTIRCIQYIHTRMYIHIKNMCLKLKIKLELNLKKYNENKNAKKKKKFIK